MLEIRNLTAGYGEQPVLRDISLQFPAGKVSVLAGPNGCGKSTLLKSIAGILPAAGEIFLEGEDLGNLSPRDRARKVAFLPQSRSIPEITVRRLVLHGRFPYLTYPRQYSAADYAAADAALEALELTSLADRNLASLSGGQRQKVYIAMALAQNTPAVLLDEPTAYLDIAHQLQLMHLARELAHQGKTVVLVLHDLTLAMEHADRLVILREGAVAASGTAEAICQGPTIRQVFGVGIGQTTVDGNRKYFYI